MKVSMLHKLLKVHCYIGYIQKFNFIDSCKIFAVITNIKSQHGDGNGHKFIFGLKSDLGFTTPPPCFLLFCSMPQPVRVMSSIELISFPVVAVPWSTGARFYHLGIAVQPGSVWCPELSRSGISRVTALVAFCFRIQQMLMTLIFNVLINL